jgi:hypothetical protein
MIEKKKKTNQITAEEFLDKKFNEWREYLIPLLPDKDYPLSFEDLLEKMKDNLC